MILLGLVIVVNGKTARMADPATVILSVLSTQVLESGQVLYSVDQDWNSVSLSIFVKVTFNKLNKEVFDLIST
jgi:hypothetical protein